MTKKSILGIVLILLIMTGVTVFWVMNGREDNNPLSESKSLEETITDNNRSEEITTEVATEETAEMTTEAETEKETGIKIEIIETTEENIEQSLSSGEESMTFTEVSETVTSKNATNLRSTPSAQDEENVVAQLLNGETLIRTGINDRTGWSRLEFGGQTVYAVSRFLTTDLNYIPPVSDTGDNRVTTQSGRIVIFEDCDDDVTPKEYVNLRVEPSTSQGDTSVRIQITNGTVVHRTGFSPDAGWSRVEYNGEVLYVVSSMVTTVNSEME